MVNPAAQAPSAEQAPRQRSSGALGNTLTLGAVGAVGGATFWAPVEYHSGGALLGLEKDKFEKSLSKVKDGSDKEALAAKKTLVEQKAIRDTNITENSQKINAVFANNAEEVSLEDVLKKHNFSTVQELESASLKEVYARNNFLANLVENEGQLTQRGPFAKTLETIGYSADEAKVLSEQIITDPKGMNLTKNKVIQAISKNDKITDETFLALGKSKNPEVQALAELVKNAPEGKVSKDMYAAFITKTNKKIVNEDTVKTAYDSVKKFLPKKRLAGAVRYAGLAMAISIATGWIFSKFSKK
ncbi:MAG: hypothetical protein PHE78_05300 [Candidatus Gastranaerophilales bacterium]|nr:hypothetical protein [Candidatus Gastranaerophilales bacterium]